MTILVRPPKAAQRIAKVALSIRDQLFRPDRATGVSIAVAIIGGKEVDAAGIVSFFNKNRDKITKAEAEGLTAASSKVLQGYALRGGHPMLVAAKRALAT